jgi:hypothetical protein
MSVVNMFQITGDLFFEGGNAWCVQQAFARSIDVASWHLIRRTPVENSFGKSMDEQRALLGKNEYVPSARALVYAMVGHYLKVRERLFSDVYARCRDMSDDSGVAVGFMRGRGLHIARVMSDGPVDGRIGLASALHPFREVPGNRNTGT